MVTVVYVIGDRYDSGALVYKDDLLIYQGAPNIGRDSLNGLVERLTGERPQVFTCKQKGEGYPLSFKVLEESWNLTLSPPYRSGGR